VKILFIGRHFTYFRNYESVIDLLASRGHRIHLAAERHEELGGRDMVERLAARHPGITLGLIPDREDRWSALATQLRLTIDYLRYLDPAYATTPKLRGRAKERVPRAALWAMAIPGVTSRPGRRVVGAMLRAFERAIPRSRRIDAYLQEQQPDVVLLTPLVGVVASPQPDYLNSAKSLGLRTALCVWSWDHLSSKAIVRNVPDKLFVWNETQRDEAVRFHGVDAARVVVTGAQCFDQWFDRQASVDRDTFCRRVGLPEGGPFLLYVCSALFKGSDSEARFVMRWLQALRASGREPLASMPVLIRPHPSRLKEWDEIDLAAERDVVLWGRNPVDSEARRDYYDSLALSSAIVGLNTSAFIEGAIAGRPIFATLLPEHRENQEGTIHFHYLLRVGGGLLHTARSIDEHLAQLNEVLASGQTESARSRGFVEAFVRPHGLGTAATPLFADAVEALAAAPSRQPVAEGAMTAVLRTLLRPAAWMAAAELAAPLVSSERERAIADRHRAVRAREEAARRDKRERKQSAAEAKQARARQRQQEKAERAAAWQRGKRTKKLKNKIKQRIGIAS
jgi:hypothetical protein